MDLSYYYILSNIFVFLLSLMYMFRSSIFSYVKKSTMFVFNKYIGVKRVIALITFIFKSDKLNKIAPFIESLHRNLNPDSYVSEAIQGTSGYYVEYKKGGNIYMIYVPKPETKSTKPRRKIVFKKKPQLSVIGIIEESEINVTEIFYKLYGPNYDFHGQDMKPNIIARSIDRLIVTNIANNHTYTFEKDDIIKLD